jgi:hypothetical protein
MNCAHDHSVSSSIHEARVTKHAIVANAATGHMRHGTTLHNPGAFRGSDSEIRRARGGTAGLMLTHHDKSIAELKRILF